MKHIKRTSDDTFIQVAKCCEIIKEQGIDMTPTYDDWLKLGFSLATLGERGREFFHIVSENYYNYKREETDKKFTYILHSKNNGKKPITTATFFDYCKKYGVSCKHGNERPIVKKKPIVRYKPAPPPSYIDPDLLKRTRKQYDRNNLIIFLKKVFGSKMVDGAIRRYFIGTSNQFGGGSTVFWQVDRYRRIRDGKIMQYNPNNGKRVKEPFNQVNWVHDVMGWKDCYRLAQCLFGEHLLKIYPDKAVAVVESEKTAIIASMIFPDCIFLASGGCENLKLERCISLKERHVVFFPDNGKFEIWSAKAKSMSHLFKSYVVSDIMEHEAIEQDDDIGDLILRNVGNANFELPELKLTNPKESQKIVTEEPKEELRAIEREEPNHAPESTADDDSSWLERSGNVKHISEVLDKWAIANPSFANLCNRLDLVAVGVENERPKNRSFVAVDADTYYFDSSGRFHFHCSPEQEQMMKRDYKTDVCPF